MARFFKTYAVGRLLARHWLGPAVSPGIAISAYVGLLIICLAPTRTIAVAGGGTDADAQAPTLRVGQRVGAISCAAAACHNAAAPPYRQ